MAIVQPFDYVNLRVKISSGTPTTPPAYIGGAQWGSFNTVLVPYDLSWKLPCDFYIKTGLGIALNDATTSPGQIPASQGLFAESGNGFYTFEPTLGVSWLHKGWNLSAEFHYAFNTINSATDYLSGQQIAVDYTATYTCGKWTFGVGAGEETQTTADRQYGQSIPDSKANAWTAGPIIGYNFGPCSVEFIYNFPIYVNNDVGGQWGVLRLVVPLWK
jgi:hypothetical protein